MAIRSRSSSGRDRGVHDPPRRVSHGPYASLNLGRWTDDDPDAVRRNCAAVAAGLGVRARATPGRSTVTEVRRESSRMEPRRRSAPDGRRTARRRAARYRADGAGRRLPAGRGRLRGAVAILHAGWRGLAGGYHRRGIRALRALGAGRPARAAIGPGRGPCCYEVGEEVHAAFAETAPRARRGATSTSRRSPVSSSIAAGVGEVHDLGLCTICADPELFFSHRRDQASPGARQGSRG